MKKYRSAIVVMVIITGAIILMVSGCKKKTEDQVVNGNVAGFYEFIMNGQSAEALTRYFQMTLLQNGTAVGGEISVHHVDQMVAGTITGSVTGGTLAFSATMDLSSLSFSFSAHSMGGLVSRGYIVSGGAITKLVTLGTPHLGTPLVSLIKPLHATQIMQYINTL